jgi:hypothetical protein
LFAIESHGVKYLIVGGFAVIYHSQPRFTKEIDLFIKADPENASAIYAGWLYSPYRSKVLTPWPKDKR